MLANRLILSARQRQTPYQVSIERHYAQMHEKLNCQLSRQIKSDAPFDRITFYSVDPTCGNAAALINNNQ